MWVEIKKATIDGEELEKEKIDWWELMALCAERINVLHLNSADDVIGREPKEFEQEWRIDNEDDMTDYIFSNYRYYHHTKARKAIFYHSGIKLHLSFN